MDGYLKYKNKEEAKNKPMPGPHLRYDMKIVLEPGLFNESKFSFDFGLQRLWTIIAPHSAPFPVVLFCSSIKGQLHVQISKIM